MTPRAGFEAAHPGVYVLEASQSGRVDLVMGACGWLGQEEQVSGCLALGGESSTVIRVELQELRGGWRTAILKQALPWLRRDESVAMPEGRLAAERRFYARVAELPEAAARMPRMMGASERRFLLLLEDFRGASSLASLYRGAQLAPGAAQELGGFLAALRRGGPGVRREGLDNVGMRLLRHRMLFETPLGLRADGLGADPDDAAPDDAELEQREGGLGRAAAALRSDSEFRAQASALGERFLSSRSGLVHGAFHPGNWLLLPDGGVRVVDPQSGGLGDPEFDVGTGLAHLLLSRQPPEVVQAFLAAATAAEETPESAGTSPEAVALTASTASFAGADEAPAEPGQAASSGAGGGDTCGQDAAAEPGLDGECDGDVDRELVARHAGVELVRRLIGGRQAPSAFDDGGRKALLAVARNAVVSGQMEALESLDVRAT